MKDRKYEGESFLIKDAGPFPRKKGDIDNLPAHVHTGGVCAGASDCNTGDFPGLECVENPFNTTQICKSGPGILFACSYTRESVRAM